MDRRSFLAGTAALAAAGPAFAQETFPSHAITIVNAFPPGGANDIVTRRWRRRWSRCSSSRW